ACRDFHAQSSVTFGAHPSESTIPVGSTQSASWPTGLAAAIEATDRIDSATASAGDIIHGRLMRPIRDAAGKIYAREGTLVQGRLMRVEVHHQSPIRVTIALRWEMIDTPDGPQPVHLMPNQTAGRPDQGGDVKGLKRRGVEFELPEPGEERYNVFHFPGTHYIVESGLRTECVTAKP
ncbi:MAG TPA: hypothetical protein VKE70_36755, partial [Candidatus Solibacter sp.]|nr:hypothetical protein [Candidatus Solibacter sp.]